MTIPSVIGGAPRVRAPEVMERGRLHVTSMEVRLGGSLVTPTSPAYALYSPTGATVYTATPTITASVMSVSIPALSLPSTLGYGPGYMEEWTCTFGGAAQILRRDAWLARRALHCPVTQADLEQLHPAIAERLRSGSNSIQPQIDSVWADTLLKLHAAGQWPVRIVEPSSLIPYVRDASLAAVFRTLIQTNSAPDSTNERNAQHYAAQAASGWASVSYLVDDDQDGVADSDVKQGPGGVYARAVPPLWQRSRMVI
jgi:hypothetical protein